jgi:hypothetical protein
MRPGQGQTVKPITAWELLNRIHALLGERPKDAMFEGRLNRTLYAPVTGMLVANEPSVEAVRLAIRTGRNCIVCRDHPYYLFGEHWSRGVEDTLRADPVVAAKRKLIEDNQILILRLGALWDTARPKWFSGALAKALGWQVEPRPEDRWSRVTCTIPQQSLAALSRSAAKTLNAKSVRVVGEPDWPIRRVAVVHGLAFPTLVFGTILKDPAVDAIVTGTTPEVDFNSIYIADAITAGRRIGLVQVGYERSEEPGAVEVAAWLREAFPAIPVDLQPPLADQAWLA